VTATPFATALYDAKVGYLMPWAAARLPRWSTLARGQVRTADKGFTLGGRNARPTASSGRRQPGRAGARALAGRRGVEVVAMTAPVEDGISLGSGGCGKS
jgi:hypothetical protein